MNGELAQVIYLATAGTVWLENPRGLGPSESSASVFKFVGSVGFNLVGTDPQVQAEEVSGSVADWLTQRKAVGINRLWLVIPGLPDRLAAPQLVAFANAGPWALLATGPERAEVWSATWAVGDRQAPERRIWTVRYQGREVAPTSPQTPDVGEAWTALNAALERALQFSTVQHLDPWPDLFRKALTSAGGIPYHPDMLPPPWPQAAHRLAAAAAQAWVFGGMGSWNDLVLRDPESDTEYQQVSRDLYAAVLRALLACVNSASDEPLGPRSPFARLRRRFS